MRTTIDIDDALMRKAMRLSGLTTKKRSSKPPYAYSFKRILRDASGSLEARSNGKLIWTTLVADVPKRSPNAVILSGAL